MILVYSEDPTGRSLSYIVDMLPHNPAEINSSKNIGPHLWKDLEDMLPSDTKSHCQYFWRDDCLHGLSGKSPVGKKMECRSIHPQLCWAFLKHGFGRNGCQGSKICGQAHPQICKASWGTGKCAGKDTCRAGYHIGEKPGQPK